MPTVRFSSGKKSFKLDGGCFCILGRYTDNVDDLIRGMDREGIQSIERFAWMLDTPDKSVGSALMSWILKRFKFMKSVNITRQKQDFYLVEADGSGSLSEIMTAFFWIRMACWQYGSDISGVNSSAYYKLFDYIKKEYKVGDEVAVFLSLLPPCIYDCTQGQSDENILTYECVHVRHLMEILKGNSSPASFSDLSLQDIVDSAELDEWDEVEECDTYLHEMTEVFEGRDSSLTLQDFWKDAFREARENLRDLAGNRRSSLGRTYFGDNIAGIGVRTESLKVAIAKLKEMGYE